MLSAIRSDLDAIGYLPVFVFLTDLADPEERRLAVLLGSTLPEPPPAHKATRDGLRNSQVQSCLHRRFSNFLMLAWRERERLMGFPVVVYDRQLKLSPFRHVARFKHGREAHSSTSAQSHLDLV